MAQANGGLSLRLARIAQIARLIVTHNFTINFEQK